MATPNQMPKKPSKVRMQMLAGLIETSPTSWNKKVWDEEKNEQAFIKVTRDGLRFPLAQNVSAESVESLSKRWMK